MSETTQEKPKGLFARIKEYWNNRNKPALCGVCNERPITVHLVGMCDECFVTDIQKYNREKRERKNNELKRAIKEALSELEEERNNKTTP